VLTRQTLKIIHQYWIPSVLTGLIGFFGGLSLPLLQDVLATDRFFLEQRVRAADTVGNEFSRYVENWRRLVAMKKYLTDKGKRKEKLNDEEVERFRELAAVRSEARDKLFSALNLLHLYYGDRVTRIVAEFKAWDEAQATKEIDQLPRITEWQAHQIRLLTAIREEIRT